MTTVQLSFENKKNNQSKRPRKENLFSQLVNPKVTLQARQKISQRTMESK